MGQTPSVRAYDAAVRAARLSADAEALDVLADALVAAQRVASDLGIEASSETAHSAALAWYELWQAAPNWTSDGLAESMRRHPSGHAR